MEFLEDGEDFMKSQVCDRYFDRSIVFRIQVFVVNCDFCVYQLCFL